MPQNVFVSGASGFVGSAVIRELLARGHSIRALVNRKPIESHGDRVTSIPGGLFDDSALATALAGTDSAIHLVGIIMERPADGITFDRMHVQATTRVVDAARRAGIKRFIHMSALGTRPTAVSTYHKTKFLAEQYVRASTLDWTIIRPSMIHGPGGFMSMEAKWARGTAPPFLFMPYFGKGLMGCRGAGLLQPVHVDDVARAFADALEKPSTIGETYPLGGPQTMTWPQLHHTCAQAIRGKRKPVAAIPAWYAKLLTRALPAALLPFNRDQIDMSQEDNTCDMTKFEHDFGWSPSPLAAGLAQYAAQL